ncbi:MAG TPA: lipoate--protein ligase family protein [Gemmatimonadaceae bacterium]|nr:lipoate--protein ligase family protein [Gemmatimonadaceae bacterium]
MRWQLLHTAPCPGSENMAIDEALLARARDSGECVLRVYGWSTPTLSLGRHQSADGLYDRARLRESGIAVVRRPTGGRAILHHREITYSVTAPDAVLGTLRESCARINRLLIDGLGRLGVEAREARSGARPPRPSGAPCFETPVTGELIVNGRKLAGSAQWRDAGALLQHGSILIDDDQSAVASLLLHPVAPPAPPATLHAALGRVPETAELVSALFAAVRSLEDPDASELEIDNVLAGIIAARRPRYDDDSWTWRR